MKLKELLAPLDVRELHADPELDITGISYDSRTTQPGELFVAVTGFAADGHKFIPKAVERGAAAILCERAPEADIPYVVAGSTRRALALVSAAWFGHPADRMTMIGVTGTNGKTTSTYLLKHILEQTLGAKVGLVGTRPSAPRRRAMSCRSSLPRCTLWAARTSSWRSRRTR